MTTTKVLKAPWSIDHQVDEQSDRMKNSEGSPAIEVFTSGNGESRLVAYDALVSAVNAATADERGETPFVIWSNVRRTWRGPEGKGGGVLDINDAACFSMDHAAEICAKEGVSLLAPWGTYVPAVMMMRLSDARLSIKDSAEVNCGIHQKTNGRWGCKRCDKSWDSKPSSCQRTKE